MKFFVKYYFRPEAATEGVLKKGVLKNFKKFTGNTCVGVSFLIKLQASPATLLKKDSYTGLFLWFFEIFKNTSFTEHLPATASFHSQAVFSE